MSPIALVLDAIATYRLTKLVTDDVLTEEPRDAIVRWAYRDQPIDVSDTYGTWSQLAMGDPHAPKLATLVTCRWCAGLWCSMFVVCMRRFLPRQWETLAKVLVLGSAAALLARLED